MVMNRDLLVNVQPKHTEIALLENSQLVELHKESDESKFSVGDVFLGKVRRTIPALNAAFVHVGHSKDAFLHYSDLGPQLKSLQKYTASALKGQAFDPRLTNFKKEKDIIKTGNIRDVVKRNQSMLVQIVKEPISSKGPRLTSDISLPGRFVVMKPFGEGVSLSRKISDPTERKRLINLLNSIKPKDFGVIVRTVAKGQKVAELHKDVEQCMAKWASLTKELKSALPPEKVLTELRKSSSIVRDLLNESFSSIVVNDKSTSNQIKEYIGTIAPEKQKLVQLYNGKSSLYDHYNVTKQIKSLFGKTVEMKSGAYLVIEHTEAMHVVDVNSGNKMGMSDDQESQAIKVNLEAAEEIARQLKLRDLGGIIIIDFIDMRNAANRKTLATRMKEFMKNDRARHTILPITRFGLLQITRQRMKPELQITTDEQCPTCQGSGKVKATLLLMDQIEEKIEYLYREMNLNKLSLKLHPFIAAYLTKGLPSKQMKWFWKYKKWTKIETDSSFNLTQFKFYDHLDEEIKN